MSGIRKEIFCATLMMARLESILKFSVILRRYLGNYPELLGLSVSRLQVSVVVLGGLGSLRVVP
jgi:hypothetical protein